jgi:integrase/recombinase XerC
VHSLMKEIALKSEIDKEKLSALVQTSLSRLKPETLRSYSYGLKNFAEYCGEESHLEALHRLLVMPRGEANFFILEYIRHLQEKGMSQSTVNARLSAIKGRVSDAQMIGLVDWSIDIKAPKVDKQKNVTGPTEAQFLRILRYVKSPRSPIEYRNRAIIYMLSFMALRRSEIVGIDFSDMDFHRLKVMVMRKGKRSKESRSVPGRTMEAILQWIDAGAISSGPLFTNFDPSKKGGTRFSATSLYRLVKKIGEECSVAGLHPHAFRHFSITEALDVTNGSTRKAQKHSGHTDPRMIDVYEDAREDEQLAVSSAIENKWIND